MFKYSLFIITFLNFSIIFSQESSIELRVENDSIIIKDEKNIKMSNLNDVYQEHFNQNAKDSSYLTSLTLKVDNKTGDVFLDKIKKELRKTNFDILNVQRTSIQNFSNSSVVTDPMLTQYNTLVKDWKSLNNDERYYRELELNFVKGIYKQMNFEQQVRNEKLPSFLPIFDHQPEEKEIEQFLFEQWIFDDSYQVLIDGEKIKKSRLQNKTPDDFEHYYVERKIIQEKKIKLIHLVTKD